MIEMIIVIVLTGIIGGMVAVFLRSPIDAYVDAARRAELTDVADTAVRRITRDVRLALSNSMRNPGDSDTNCVEFIPTKSGGRYRAATETAGGGDALDFTVVDDKFDMLTLNSSLPTSSQISANDVVVVFNTESCDSATCTGSAYRGANAVQIAAGGVVEPGGTANSTQITFVGTAAPGLFNRKQFPSASPYYRFQVIPSTEHVVSYVCSGVTSSGGGTLYRYRRTLSTAWSTPATCAAMASGASAATLATNVSSCSFKYEPPGSSTGLGNSGILAIALEITQSGESARIYHQVHMDNSP